MRKSILVSFAVSLLLPLCANAQMMGGHPRGSMPGAPPATMPGPGMMGAMDCDRAGDRGLVVAADGSLLLARPSASEGRTEIVVIQNGTIRWKKDVDGTNARLFTGNDRVYALVATPSPDAATVKSTVWALALGTGANVYQVELMGAAHDAEPFSGGMYVLLKTIDPDAANTSGHCGIQAGNGPNAPAVKTSVVAIGNDGSILWTLAL